jgi:hypothetical protein
VNVIGLLYVPADEILMLDNTHKMMSK